MSYSLANGIITQTGTDLDFSGLANVTGVSSFEENGRRIFILDNLRVTISGVQYHNPENEELYFKNYTDGIVFRIDGVYVLGEQYSSTGRFTSGTALRFTGNSNSAYSEAHSDVYISTSGLMDWQGGTIFSDRQFSNYGSWYTHSTEAKLIGYTTGRKNIRQRGAAYVNGFVSSDYILGLIVNPFKFANWVPYSQSEKVINPSSSFPSNVFAEIEGFNPTGVALEQANHWARKWLKFINCFTGSDIYIVGLNAASNNNRGLYEIRQKVRLKYLDVDLNSLNGVKVSMTDTNNGVRLAANLIHQNPSYTADRTYTGTSANGEILFDTDGGVLVAVHWRSSGGTRGVPGDSLNRIDYRGLTNDNSDTFRFYSCDYLLQITASTKALKGANGEDLEVIMLTDRSITEQTKATVDAYTSIDNANEFYDRAKSYLYDNFAGESSTYVSRDGTAIDAGAFNVVVDATAASAFAVSGSTITIKSSRYFGDITTTGTITLANGATVIGTRTDSTGTSKVTTLTFTGLKTDTEVRIYDGTTEVAGVDNSGTSETFDIEQNSVDVVIHALNFLNQNLTVATTENTILPISQVLDRQYNNP